MPEAEAAEPEAEASSRSNRASSLLARKSDSTPNTGLSLLLSPPPASELFPGATAEPASHARKASSGAHSLPDAAPRTPPPEPKAAQAAGTPDRTAPNGTATNGSPSHGRPAGSAVGGTSGSLNGGIGGGLVSASGSVNRGMALGARSPALGGDVNPLEAKTNAARDPGRRDRAVSVDSKAGLVSGAPAETEPKEREEEAVADAADGEAPEEPRAAGDAAGSPVESKTEEMVAPDAVGGRKVPEFLDQDPMKDGPVRDPVTDRNGTPF